MKMSRRSPGAEKRGQDRRVGLVAGGHPRKSRWSRVQVKETWVVGGARATGSGDDGSGGGDVCPYRGMTSWRRRRGQ